MEFLVAIFGIVFSIGLPLAVLMTYIVLKYRQRRTLMELHHAQRMAAIERGLELPPLSMEMFERPARRRRTSLLPALVWFFVGVAILIGMQSIAEDEALIGLIPAGVGLAYFIYYLAEGRKIEAEARMLERDLSKAASEVKV